MGQDKQRLVMVDWDIDVAAASGIVAQTVDEMLKFHQVEKDMQAAIDGAAGASASAGIKAALESAQSDYLGLLLSNATARSTNACNGTAQAINWYNAGNLEMAANAQRNASKVPQP
jgi:hypothetical protein